MCYDSDFALVIICTKLIYYIRSQPAEKKNYIFKNRLKYLYYLFIQHNSHVEKI